MSAETQINGWASIANHNNQQQCCAIIYKALAHPDQHTLTAVLRIIYIGTTY